MKKIGALTLILGCFTIISYSQDVKEIIPVKKDPSIHEMGAKADVISVQPTNDKNRISSPGIQRKDQEKTVRREQRLLRRQQRMVRHQRLRRSFHHQHTLIRRR